MNDQFETIVLGLGAMGSAATYQLAKRGNRVLGIDQFSPPHTFGSTHGDTRVTRLAMLFITAMNHRQFETLLRQWSFGHHDPDFVF